MKVKWQSEIGVKEPVMCPECPRAMRFISVGQHGNFLTNETTRFVAFYGCKHCKAAMVCEVDQDVAETVWKAQLAAHADDKLIHNPIDEFFARRTNPRLPFERTSYTIRGFFPRHGIKDWEGRNEYKCMGYPVKKCGCRWTGNSRMLFGVQVITKMRHRINDFPD